MKLPINKTTVVGLCVLLAVMAAGAVLLTASGILGTNSQPVAGLREGMPLSLDRHIEKLIQTVPGNSGEPREGPGLAEEDAFLQRAYPDDSIPLERIEAAQAAATALQRRGFPTGKGRPGTFVSVGP